MLFTGRIVEQKGLFDIIDAMGILVEKGEDLILDLLGWMEVRDERMLDKLMLRAQQYGCENRVIYHGYKKVGQELFALYKQADIYTLASTSDFEGFPRAIWEAMAHSLPVVATRVGSIPYYLADMKTAVLVNPQQVDELAEAIHRLIHDPALRQNLILNAMILAHENTLEKRISEMVICMEQWVETRKR